MPDTPKARHITVAARRRAEALTLVAEGLLDPGTVVSMAAAPGNEALLAMPLRSLLGAHELWGDAAADADVQKLLTICGRATASIDVTIAWLFHRKVSRVRILALADIIRGRMLAADDNEAPWPGFPMTAPPAGEEV